MNETFYSDNDYRLYHYGRLGMHWGVKNGPPYPLDGKTRARMKREAKEARPLSEEEKQKALRGPDMKTIKKHADEFSNKELQDAVNRMNLKQQVKKKADVDPVDFIDKKMKTVSKAVGWVGTGIAVYNLLSKLYNATHRSRLPNVDISDYTVLDNIDDMFV